MGSLMAGWDSPVLMDPDTARLERNRSLTKEEIHSFWRLHRKLEEGDAEFGEEPLSPSSYKNSVKIETGEKKSTFWKKVEKRSNKTPSPTPPDSPTVEAGRDNKITGDWWTRSNWAFLNEPPRDQFDESAHKYTAQFHVAQIANKGHAQLSN